MLTQLNDKSDEAEQRMLDAMDRAIVVLQQPTGAEVSCTKDCHGRFADIDAVSDRRRDVASGSSI